MSKAILGEALALITLSPLIFLYGWPGTLALLAAVGLLMVRNVQNEQSVPRPAAAPPPEPEREDQA